LILASRLRFLADQFRRRPAPESAEAAQDQLYGSPRFLEFYSQHLREGLYESEQRLLERGHLAPGQDLLDVGCGTGREAQGFQARGLRVTAVDASPAMVERARKLSPEPGIRFLVAGLTQLDLPPSSFDAAYISSDVYQKTPGRSHRVAALAQFHRLLRPGGRVIVPVMSIRPSSSLKARILVDAPLSLIRRAWPERAIEPGDRFFRSGAGTPPLLTHLFRDDAEVAAEIADAGLALVDILGDFFVSRTPGGDQRFRCPAGVQSAPAAADLLLVDVGRGAAFRLNPTACAMWKHLACGETLPATAAGLAGALGAPRERLEADAALLAAELLRHRLLEPWVERPLQEPGESR
jgi:SAM-dependent methyltransferase